MLTIHATYSLKAGRLAKMRQLLLGAALAGVVSSQACAASSQAAVQLIALDGSAIIKGELIEVSDGSYVVKTALGTLRIGLDEAECSGDACPGLDRFDADFAIHSQGDAVKSSMRALLTGYAQDVGADLEVADSEDGSSEVSLKDQESGQRLANVTLDLSDGRSPSTGVRISKAVASSSLDEDGDDGVTILAELTGSADNEEDLLVALDGIALIVHPDNPIAKMSRETMADLFACREKDFQVLRNGRGPVTVYSHQAASEAFQTFKAQILDPFGVELCADAIELPSDDVIAEAVAEDRNGIGFVTLTHVHKAKPLAIRECSLAYEPTLFNVKAGDYPLVRQLLLHAPPLGDSSGAVQQFIDFAQSEGGQKRFEGEGFVSLSLNSTRPYATQYRLMRIEAAAGVAQDVAAIERMIIETRNAARLSSTFHFSTGTSDVGEAYGLDNRSQRDLTRLVNYLEAEMPKDTEVLVFGFADSSGDYQANLNLSRQRAQSIADKLAAFGIPVSLVSGFGEEAPIACNSDPAGRAKNRRVEIWLRFKGGQLAQQSARVTM
jgi:phosphate transport system substrate-binding protein